MILLTYRYHNVFRFFSSYWWTVCIHFCSVSNAVTFLALTCACLWNKKICYVMLCYNTKTYCDIVRIVHSYCNFNDTSLNCSKFQLALPAFTLKRKCADIFVAQWQHKVFQQVVSCNINIYILEGSTCSYKRDNFSDLYIRVIDDKFVTSIYHKVDDFQLWIY